MVKTLTIDLRKVFHYCVFTFLVISTFFYLPVPQGMPIEQAVDLGYQIQEMFFKYGIVFLFGLSLFLRPLRSFKFESVGSLLIYLLILGVFNFNFESRRLILNVFTALVFFKVISENWESKYLKTLSVFSFGILLLNLILCVAQYYGYDPIFSKPSNMGRLDSMVGFMKLKAHLGVLSALLTPFVASLSPWLLIVPALLIIISVSSTAAFAFVACLIFMAYSRVSRKAFISIITGLSILGAVFVLKYDMPGGQFCERFYVWFAALAAVLRENPFFGVGLGFFAKWMPITSQVTVSEKLSWIWAHNEYIQFIFESGIVGFVFLLLCIRRFFLNFKQFSSDKTFQVIFASFLAIFIVSFLHFPFHLGRFAPYLVFILGIFNARYLELKDLRNDD